MDLFQPEQSGWATLKANKSIWNLWFQCRKY